MIRRALLLGVSAAALAAPAHAGVVVSPQQAVGPDGVSPRVELTRDGGVLLAWSGRGHMWGENPNGTEGVFVTRRPAGGSYLPPEKVAGGNSVIVGFGRAGDGPLLVAWNQWMDPGETADDRVMLALAPSAALPFAAAEVVPTPARTQGTQTSAVSAAMAPDGHAVIALAESNYSGYSRALLVERSVDGTYSTPALLAEGVLRGPKLTLAGDRLVASWTGIVMGAANGSPRRLWVSERTAAGTWSPPQAISTAERDADNGAAEPHVIANERGDLLAVWNSLPPAGPHGGPMFPDSVEVARRPAGGAWSAPSAVSGEAFRPTAAISANGTAAVVWNGFPSISSSFAAPGQPFGAPEPSIAEAGENEGMPLAVDDAGRAVLLRRAGAGQTPRFFVFGREPGKCFSQQAEPTPAGTVVNFPTIAGRADGTGVIAWSQPDDGAVHAADYRQDPAVPGGPCPRPAEPPKPAAAPAITLGSVAKRVRTRDLLRRGLRVAVATSRPADVEVALIGEPRKAKSPPPVVAHRKLGMVSRKVLRLRAKRRPLARSSRRKALVLVVVARDGEAVSVERRRVRVR